MLTGLRARGRRALAIDRRSFSLAFSLGSAALLSGCATPGRGQLSGCSPLQPVKVDPDRVIRTMAGLRPYRRQGFVVRAEQFGEKKLVHNYGHGGGGITLSWGSAKLAAELGLAGHQGAVAVLGSGVMGLSTARLVQEAGFPVTIYAAALPPETTSNIAGGQFHPYAVFEEDSVTPEFNRQFLRALDYSWRRFQIMVGEDYGVRWLPTYVERDTPEAQLLATFPPINRMLTPAEHPFPLEHVYRYDTLYVETGRYLRQLIRDFEIAGGRFVIRTFAAPPDIAQLTETLLFNCTGLGSRALFNDPDLRPARGQLAILEPQSEIGYAFTGGGGYMFPRPDGIVLGGTFELDQWDARAQPETIARILDSQKRFFAGFRCTPRVPQILATQIT